MKDRKKDWGHFVDVKINALEVLEKELDKIKKTNIKVLLGSITEIFQLAEQTYHLTEGILRLLKKRDIPFIILTKSVLIKNYINVLTYSDKNIVYFTYNTGEAKQLFEKKTSDYKSRLEIMKILLKNNIKLTVYISPYFPFISDYKAIMNDLSSLPCKGLHLYFEGYNLRMGNWQDIKPKLSKKLLNQYINIYSDQGNYNQYWEDLQNSILQYNKEFNYDIKFFNYPFDDYYRNKL